MSLRPEFLAHRQRVLDAMAANPGMSDEEVMALWFHGDETAAANREALLGKFRIESRKLKAQRKVKGVRVTGEFLRELKRQLIGRVYVNLRADFGMTESQSRLYLQRVGVLDRRGKIMPEFGGET